MLVFRHPKYYEEMRRRAKKFQKEQADKQASERASRGAGGPRPPACSLARLLVSLFPVSYAHLTLPTIYSV